MATVELAHLDKVYPGGTRAVTDLTLAVADGELLEVGGPLSARTVEQRIEVAHSHGLTARQVRAALRLIQEHD